MTRRPDVVGRIDRRVLIDRAVAPEAAARHLPAGLELRLLDDRAVVGVCLIRLVDVRPAGLPAAVGITVEAAAHRISVVGDAGDGPEPGVYVPRRDTSSWAAALAGGRLWPGVHRRASVAVARGPSTLAIAVAGPDVGVEVAVDLDARAGTLLTDADAAGAFHAVERTAWSPRRDGGLETAMLACERWSARPVGVLASRSSWLDDPSAFAAGSSTTTGALLMEDIPIRWTADRVDRTARVP